VIAEGLEKAKNLAGEVLRPIQTASSETEFQEHLTCSSSRIATSTGKSKFIDWETAKADIRRRTS